MRHVMKLTLATALLASLPQLVADAHFKLLAPESWIVEDQRGDPQKLGPCGGTAALPGTPSNIVGQVKGGSMLHIKLLETIYHPGHYRVALAVNAVDELPPDAIAVERFTEKGPLSVSAPIQNPVVKPVLADGLWPHAAKPAAPQTWETDVELPNINCPKCMLQITQFMAEHGYNKDGGYTYHHCAALQITADAAKPMSTGWPMPIMTRQ
ncbi:MAG: SCE4755 family polysaccharide monooxygenase-like protein [Vicinamibacterales bacterium]